MVFQEMKKWILDQLVKKDKAKDSGIICSWVYNQNIKLSHQLTHLQQIQNKMGRQLVIII